MIEIAAKDIPPDLRVAIVASRFNAFIVEQLLAGARDALERSGIAPDQQALVWVSGAFELLNCRELPVPVVLDECIDLAQRFGSEQGHSFVNAVLDRAARHWRAGSTGDS